MRPLELKKSRISIIAVIFILSLGLVLTFGSLAVAEEKAGHGSETAVDSHEGDAAEDHGDSSSKMWNLLYRATNFLVMVIIIVVLGRKAARQFFGNRRQEIANTLSSLEEKKLSAEDRYKELEKKLNELEAERKNILEAFTTEGEIEKEKIIEDAHRQSERIQEQAETAIQREIKQAKASLKKEIAEMSTAMAEEMVRDNINDQDQKRLMEESLKKVVSN